MKTFLMAALLIISSSSFAARIGLKASEVNFNQIGNPELEIEKAFLTIRCLRKATFFEQLNNGAEKHTRCDGYKINNKTPNLANDVIELSPNQTGGFDLPSLSVQYSTRRKGHVCFGLSVKFKGIPSYETSAYMENAYDAYSLHSYCTMSKLPVPIGAYVYNNKRVDSLRAFSEYLERGIDVVVK